MLGRLRRQAPSIPFHVAALLAVATVPVGAASPAVAALPAGAAQAPAPPAQAPPPKDPLALEIERWSAYLQSNATTDELWGEVKQAATPAMTRAADALRDGRRLLALQRLAAARVDLSAWQYLAGRPAGERKEDAGFEAEWSRIGKDLKGDMGPLTARALEGVRPAALRAIGEAALPQIKVFYDASLEYGRNTMPDMGLFYLGSARAQRDLIAFCRTLSGSPAGASLAGPPTAGGIVRRPPPVRDIAAEIDALEDDLLALYRPPASIERHVEFIVAASALKEARELNQAGLRYGALMRYLDAARRVAPLRLPPAATSPSAAPGPDPAALTGTLGDFEARLAKGDVDQSLGRLYLEMAQADSIAAPAEQAPGLPPPGTVRAAIASEVLPRYFAALARAVPAPPRPPAKVTVTMVRWPYT